MPSRDRSAALATKELLTQIGLLKRAQVALGSGEKLPDWDEFRHCIAGANRVPRRQDVVLELVAIEASVPRIPFISAQISSAIRVIGAQLLEEMAKSKPSREDYGIR